jgi:hypothetical protein
MVGALITDAVAESRGKLSVESVIKAIQSGDWKLFAVVSRQVDAICIVEIYREMSGLKTMAIKICTGARAHAWVHLVDEIAAEAKRQGCGKLIAIARKGWAKHLADFKLTHVMLERDL